MSEPRAPTQQQLKAATIEELFRQAESEITSAKLEEFKARIKLKMAQLQKAKLVVSNIDREIEDLRQELEQQL